jgi:metal iron transporter
MTVAIVMGRSGIDTLLVASQVVLSITLPFITYPLIYCTSSKTIMSVRRPRSTVDAFSDESIVEEADDEIVDFSSGRVMTTIGAVIWLVVVAANLYVIVSLGMGKGG